MNLTSRGHVTPADKARNDYVYIPFELPAPARRLHVQYRYSAPISSDEREGGNVIDIGLFDPRGADPSAGLRPRFPGGAGFRGWSGSARSEFTITPADATPGYLPGPLPAGRYQIILGLYRIWSHGADYTIEIEADLEWGMEDGGWKMERGFHSPLSIFHPPFSPFHSPSSLIWLRGDLQSHTEHSDAKGTVRQLVDKARELGLDFLAVTDHNSVSHHPRLAELADQEVLLIPGQEVTTFYGHMNVWGTSRWCDFRCRSDADMAAVIDLAHRNGGVCSINHPKTNGPPWEYSPDLPVDAMEVWQGPWPHRNEESLALWDRLLNAGRRLPAVGGSDYHCPAGAEMNFLRLGQPTTWVKASARSVPAILDAIRAGRVSISVTPDGPRLDLRAGAGQMTSEMGGELSLSPGAGVDVEVEIKRGADWTLRLIADGAVAHEEPVTATPIIIRVRVPAERYVRAELVGDVPREFLPANAPPDIDLRDWRWALTNPVYLMRGA